MSGEEYVAVLNPFSEAGKEVVKDAPSFESLSNEIIDLAVERVGWEDSSDLMVGFDVEEIRKEVLSFYLMCQGIASVS
ncbi:hypothetical protein AKJ50_01425, partial [candidate division MSBL1 archaeon SCGC-AAA382A13]